MRPTAARNAANETDRIERGSVAVVVIDIVSYCQLVEADELGTYARWRRLREDVVKAQLSAHRGVVVKSTGDGYLVTFRSTTDAVRASLAIQEHVAESPLGSRGDPPIQLRIAVTAGDIIFDGGDVYGDHVNIAARLQEYAEPGGIVITAAVYEETHRMVGLAVRDLGTLRLRNFSNSVHGYAVLMASGAPAKAATLRTHAARMPSIAVLPPRIFGGTTENRYVADGIAHDLVASLSGLGELFVVSSYSTVGLASERNDLATVARQLGVRYLVTGSMRRVAEHVSLTLQLTDTTTRSLLWADRVEVELAQVFAVQDAFAGKIAHTLVPHVRQAELRQALRKRPENMDAYDMLLQAIYRIYRLGDEAFAEARVLLLRAIELDPDYTTAYAYLAKWYILWIAENGSGDFAADSAQAARYAAKALELDAANPLALAIHGHVQAFLFGKLEEARAIFERALAIAPNSVVAWGFSSATYAYLGDGEQAVLRAERAMRLSPLDPFAPFYQGLLTVANYINGTYEEAVRWGRHAMASDPRLIANMRPLITSLVAAERLDEAREVARQLLQVQPNFRVTPFIARYPLRDPERKRLYAERLLAAGLPA